MEAILFEAARIFGERGYAATTTNHVAEAAGISIGSLYQYFPNKDALLVALEERHLAEATVVLRSAAARWRLDCPGVEQWAKSFIDVLVEVNDSPMHVLIYDTAPPLPHLRNASEALVNMIAADVAVHLRRWGYRRSTKLRAQLMVVAALRLVHDIVIRIPSGPARQQARAETERLIAAAVMT